MAVDFVREYNGNTVIAVSNRGEIPMPVELEITYEDGTTELLRLPVEIWQRGDSWNHMLKSEKAVKSVELDPEKILPDVNYSNDSWPNSLYQD